MPCPECNHNIDHLNAQRQDEAKFYLDQQGNPVYESGEVPDTDFYCPNCQALLTDDQSEAEEILKGNS